MARGIFYKKCIYHINKKTGDSREIQEPFCFGTQTDGEDGLIQNVMGKKILLEV